MFPEWMAVPVIGKDRPILWERIIEHPGLSSVLDWPSNSSTRDLSRSARRDVVEREGTMKFDQGRS